MRLDKLAVLTAAASNLWPCFAAAQSQEAPPVVSPIRVETDQNGVNVATGRTTVEGPVLSVPAAPNLAFDRVQNAAPYDRERTNFLCEGRARPRRSGASSATDMQPAATRWWPKTSISGMALAPRSTYILAGELAGRAMYWKPYSVQIAWDRGLTTYGA